MNARWSRGCRWVLAAGLVWATAPGCDLSRPPVELDSVADAPEHHQAKRLSFSGTLRPDLMGEHSWRNASSNRGARGTGNPLYMIAVPVVPEGWTEDQPVPLWITASNKESDPERRTDWLERVKAVESGREVGKVVDFADREAGFRKASGWQKAIDAAEAEHGITSDPHAPVVVWPDPG